MGQNNSSNILSNNNYTIMKELPNGCIIQQETSNKLHFLKEYSFTNQQAYQQAFVHFSKKLPEKHQHILYLERTNTKVENTFCSTFYKIGLVYQYLDHTLQNEIQQRVIDRKAFDEKEVWSVLCSCALAVTQMIRLEGRCHSAIKTKDIRLTKEGVVKILSLQMIGMDSDHDANVEGTTKLLAITILNCLLMKQITNDSSQILEQLVESIECTSQMKNILHMMLSQNTVFVELEEYLFKLVQEETDSLGSYTNTPALHQKSKAKEIYSLIPEESKQDDMLNNLTRDEEDSTSYVISQMQTIEFQNPDQNDIMDDSKSKCSDSNMNTLREKNVNFSEGGFVEGKKSFLSNKMDSNFNSRQNENQIHAEEKKESRVKLNQRLDNLNENCLFTDPKLLSLIHNDLQAIKRRKQTANSIKKSTETPYLEIKDESKNYYNLNQIKKKSSITDISFNNVTAEFAGDQKIKEGNNNRSISNQNIKAPTANDYKPQSQKEFSVYRTNPQHQKKIEQKKYDNIMQNEEMGFRKNKVVAPKEKEIESIQSNNLSSFNVSERSQNANQFYDTNPRMILNDNSEHNSIKSKEYPYRKEGNVKNYYESNDMGLKMKANTIYEKMDENKPEKRSKVSGSQNNEKKQNKGDTLEGEFEYVSETYVRGRYEGTKLSNMRHGKGVFYYNEGGKYIGSWKENKMHGKGVLYYPNTKIAYEGQWRNDQLFGFGTLYNEEVTEFTGPFDYRDWTEVDQYWVKYEGQFSQDNKEGDGKLYLGNGQIFEGKFKNDMVSGQGILFRKDGSRIKGIWRDNKLIRIC